MKDKFVYYKEYKNVKLLQIPQLIFGKRITIQSHKITKPKRGKDILDCHGCDQVDAKGDVKLFSRGYEIY
jgi:hypothetical protein